jgi:hypothetical protein
MSFETALEHKHFEGFFTGILLGYLTMRYYQFGFLVSITSCKTSKDTALFLPVIFGAPIGNSPARTQTLWHLLEFLIHKYGLAIVSFIGIGAVRSSGVLNFLSLACPLPLLHKTTEIRELHF